MSMICSVAVFAATNSEPYVAVVGSPQVSFLMCTLEIPQNNAVQVLCS